MIGMKLVIECHTTGLALTAGNPQQDATLCSAKKTSH
jgi:hypothetical protein